jgi:hypothetical protein
MVTYWCTELRAMNGVLGNVILVCHLLRFEYSINISVMFDSCHRVVDMEPTTRAGQRFVFTAYSRLFACPPCRTSPIEHYFASVVFFEYPIISGFLCTVICLCVDGYCCSGLCINPLRPSGYGVYRLPYR